MDLKLVAYNDHFGLVDAVENKGCFLIQLEDKMIGVTWLREITDTDAQPGIYIMEPEYWIKGLHKEATNLLIEIAFNDMNLQKLYINFKKTPSRTRSCYEDCGFMITKRTLEPYTADTFYEGVLEMTLYKKKWVLHRELL
jgi:RimJ/RimL family protein N-acetyltransferase